MCLLSHDSNGWGAEASTATVAMMVNRVKTMRQSLSTTIAANFHSFVISAASSSFRILSVIIRSSFRMSESSRWAPRQGWWLTVAAIGSSCEPPIRHPGVECGVRSVAGLKSSSISRTFASRLLEDRSFNSISRIWSRILAVAAIVFNVILSPGRLILRNHGSHCRNTTRIQLDISCVSAERWW